jgi:hypothetical protein
MSGSASTLGYRRHGLYYPYFHVRDDRWLKVAALYWPKLVRIVPEGFPTRDSDTVCALSASDFIVRRPPGNSVEAIAPRFVELAAGRADDLRSKFRVTIQPSGAPRRVRGSTSLWGSTASGKSTFLASLVLQQFGLQFGGADLAAVHASQMTTELQDTLVDAQLAVRGGRQSDLVAVMSSLDGGPLLEVGDWEDYPAREWDEWILMHPQLVSVYTSVLAEDFAMANSLQPTTDQDDAYAVTNNWTADRIAAALLDTPDEHHFLPPDALPEALGFLDRKSVV